MFDQAKYSLLKSQAQTKRDEHTRATAQHEAATKQLAEIDKELAMLGVNPLELESEIVKQDGIATEKLAKAEELVAGMNQPAATPAGSGA